MNILVVPVLRDNYTYFIVDEPTRSCLIIDPPDAEAVLARLKDENLKPAAIWLTHHHGDHVAGVPELKTHFPELPVLCSRRDFQRIDGATQPIQEGDRLSFAGTEAEVLELPGHAEGHVAYHFQETGHLFCGDVIFGASCGAVFGDTHSEMYRSVTRVKTLPESTKLWCGHEYTKNNLRFAQAVLGEAALAERVANFQVPSMPLSLAEEHQTNPFMRLSSPEVLGFLNREPGDDEATFKALRLAKNQF